MTITNAAVDAKTDAEKAHDKLTEKRRALGRGLESLLPGPRAVVPTLPQSTRKDGAPALKDGTPTPDASSLDSSSLGSATAESGGGQAGMPVAQSHIGEIQAAAAGGEHAFEIALDQIEQNPYQTREEFDPKALADLAGSIQTQGLLQPIVVRPRVAHYEGEQRYVLILGERRFRASKLAGKTTIPVIVKRVSEQQAAEMTLVENLQRQDLGCLEQASAFAKLSLQFKLTHEEIGKRVGVSREQVSNYLRLLSLPPEVQALLRQKELTYSHARLLLTLADETQITTIARLVIAKKMSVALLEELVVDKRAPKGKPGEPQQGGARWMDPNVKAAQRSLEIALGMRVHIRDRQGKGKITIEYGTLEDFDRVVEMLKGK